MVLCSRAIVTVVGSIHMSSMDRDQRKPLRASISHDVDDPAPGDLDTCEAGRIFRFLMSDKVEERRRFIEENAVNVKNLDI